MLELLALVVVFFLLAVGLLLVVLWRGPEQLARTVTRPLAEQLRELTGVVEQGARALEAQGRELREHSRRLGRLEAR